MAKIILVTGGCRSGKSRFAQQIAEEIGVRRLYVATAPVLDEEMAQRVARHREMRSERNWDTREETLDVATCLNEADAYDVALCDCLTLWVNNLLYKASQEGVGLDEDDVARQTQALVVAAQQTSAAVIFVTNEVGAGIVPADELSRRFRDLAGRCNQVVAAAADSVFLTVCGVPVRVKGMQDASA